MTKKQQLVDYINKNGKNKTWKELADMFGFSSESGPRKIIKNLKSKQINYIQIEDGKNIQQKVTITTNQPGNQVKYQYLDTYNVVSKKPENEKEEFEQWKKEKDKLKNQEGMHVVIGCMHLPAVNIMFFTALIKFLKDYKAELKGFHLIGDILDCKSLSQHDLGRISDTTLGEEYEQSNKYLDIIDSVLPSNIEKNYLWGNHEQRMTRVMEKVDMAKFSGALMTPTQGGKFIERGYTVQEDYKNARIQLGKYLDLIHGDYICANPAKKHLDVYKKSIMFAHTHKIASYFDTDKASFNIGWFGDSSDPAFDYCSRITRSTWQNGFAVVNIDELGFYHVTQVQWYNNRFYFGGKEYR